MAQIAVSSSEDSTELLGVPSFWGKPLAEPPYPWEVWIGQIFLAVSLKENCDPNILLTDPAEVHDDPPPRPELICALWGEAMWIVSKVGYGVGRCSC